MAAIEELGQEAVVTTPGVTRMTRRQRVAAAKKLRREHDRLMLKLRKQRAAFIRSRGLALDFRVPVAAQRKALAQGNQLRLDMRKTNEKIRMVRAQLAKLALSGATGGRL